MGLSEGAPSSRVLLAMTVTSAAPYKIPQYILLPIECGFFSAPGSAISVRSLLQDSEYHQHGISIHAYYSQPVPNWRLLHSPQPGIQRHLRFEPRQMVSSFAPRLLLLWWLKLPQELHLRYYVRSGIHRELIGECWQKRLFTEGS